MTPEERRIAEWECTRLVHHYANLNDEARWEEASALFVESGILTRPSAPTAPIVGRPAILASFLARPPRTTRHVCANVVIDVETATEARGTSAMLLFTGAEAPPLIGGFADRFVLTAEGWRFAERRGMLTF